jgi:hypothetical protein
MADYSAAWQAGGTDECDCNWTFITRNRKGAFDSSPRSGWLPAVNLVTCCPPPEPNSPGEVYALLQLSTVLTG